MADIYLGLTESAINPLPPIRWRSGTRPEFPIEYSKQIDKATMLSGATRFNFRSHHPRRWTLQWEMLDDTELGEFITLNGYNSELAFQNNWEDATWRDVVIVSFSYKPVLTVGPTGCRYDVTLVLEEVLG